MYTRVPNKKNSFDSSETRKPIEAAIVLPKNYSGNAFTSDGHKREINTSAPESQPSEYSERKKPHISPSPPPKIPEPSESPLGYSDYPAGEYIRSEQNENNNPAVEPQKEEAPAEETHNEFYEPHAAQIPNESSKARSGSFLSSIIPNGIFKNNFPFGHGLGSEEFLILGIMLSIYLSGEADAELMMLLCILLFAG